MSEEFGYDDDEGDIRDLCEDDDDEDEGGAGFTVSMKGAPNMATVQWVSTEKAALEKTAREWGCKVDQLYIYRGRDE